MARAPGIEPGTYGFGSGPCDLCGNSDRQVSALLGVVIAGIFGNARVESMRGVLAEIFGDCGWIVDGPFLAY